MLNYLLNRGRPGKSVIHAVGAQMIHRYVAVVMLIAAGGQTLAADPLTIGSAAPPLDLAAFVKGEPVKQLAKGVVYVIEFSGTSCVPCIRCIPHLTELQKRYPQVMFLSVYTEKEEAVRQFLAKHGEAVGFRVAIDHNDAMESTWLRAASLAGIPSVFVVGVDGSIAWIGRPLDLDEPLRKLLVEGKLDTRLDLVRLRLEQTDVAASVAARKRMDQSSKLLSHINDELVMQRKWNEAVLAAEKGARDYPEAGFAFSCCKLFALAANPATTDKAIEFAARLSATVQYSWGELTYRNRPLDYGLIAQQLACGENTDPRLLEAATILLRAADATLSQIQSDDERLSVRIRLGQIWADVQAYKKDFDAAAARLREVLALLREQPFRPRTGEEPKRQKEQWDRNHLALILRIEAKLAEYASAGAKGK